MERKPRADRPCFTRRQFLVASGGATTTTFLLLSLPGVGETAVPARLTRYPKKKIAKLSRLKQDVPVDFRYPFDSYHLSASSIVVKLGVPAGGGVGPDKDIVAFNSLCTHLGGPLHGSYKKEHKAMGPCPFHLTTYDLTRYGMMIAGHATESLPQVLLEVDGDDIYATGMIGLVYGRVNNLREVR